MEGIEIKGSICRKGTKCSFEFSKIRCAGTDWKHLFLIGRLSNPVDWGNVSELDKCVWLGYVNRQSYEQALMSSNYGFNKPTRASVSPLFKGSWLGKHVHWVKFANLTRQWWNHHVLLQEPWEFSVHNLLKVSVCMMPQRRHQGLGPALLKLLPPSNLISVHVF